MYADVIINNNSSQTEGPYTYAVPEGMDVHPGNRVWVSFAGRKLDGYVMRVLQEPEREIAKIKEIQAVDEEVSLTEEMLATCRWMQERYYCRAIEAIHCFTPAGAPSKRGKKRSPVTEAPKRDEKKNLTAEQKQALAAILPALRERRHEVTVVHGVTGSGKTELYLQVIEEVIREGRKAILLVPEISLTPQAVERFLARFGQERVAVLHSKLSAGQRYDEWMRARRNEVDVVIGARSACFAPLEQIGVIILDEEHESSYRSDQTPKYDTAEVAITRAQAWGAAVLLGSATPSVVTTEKANAGTYRRVTLQKRYNETPLPAVEVVDMRRELLEGNRSIFSRSLFDAMEKTLREGKQIILFLNRRGYAGFLNCRTCGYTMKCPDCGIALTVHQHPERAVCHYCGRSFPIPKVCPECGSNAIRGFGIGTERVEEEIAKLFPDATLARMDFDTVQRKGAGEAILKAFGSGKTQILIGTQLVAKGLDFANVGLVGILAADLSLNIPDYRSAERTYQLVTQAAGRSGRGSEQGNVIIQTYSPQHYAIQSAAAQEYETFYRTEISVRQMLGYPPYTDMIQLSLSADTEEEAASGAEKVKRWLMKHLPEEVPVLGPREAPLKKAGGKYRYQLLLKVKIEDRDKVQPILVRLKEKTDRETHGRWIFVIDVNPYSFQ